jgi:hypothetical protein
MSARQWVMASREHWLRNSLMFTFLAFDCAAAVAAELAVEVCAKATPPMTADTSKPAAMNIFNQGALRILSKSK